MSGPYPYRLAEPEWIGQAAAELTFSTNPPIFLAPSFGVSALLSHLSGFRETSFGNVVFQGALGAAIGGAAGAFLIILSAVGGKAPTAFDTLFGSIVMLAGGAVGIVNALAENRGA